MVDAPTATAPLSVRVEGLTKSFDRFAALNGVDLEVRPGELLALLGPSGSGKTTLLRMIAGLEFPDSGRVLFDGDDVTNLAAAGRRVGFVFQQYALFKHMTLARNVGFGLDVRRRGARVPRAERDRRVEALLTLVELGGMGGRYPAQLSGGQRQRVALARALAVEPRVLLLDEPFGALDATVRKTLRRELRRLHDATGLTTVFVTHDQEEALELADRVAVLNAGRIEQVGAPGEVQDAPASAFVAGFVGEANRVTGVVAGGVFEAAGLKLEAGSVAEGPATAFIRPDQLVTDPAGALRVRVERGVVSGFGGRLECIGLDGARLEIAVPRAEAAAARPGEALGPARHRRESVSAGLRPGRAIGRGGRLPFATNSYRGRTAVAAREGQGVRRGRSVLGGAFAVVVCASPAMAERRATVTGVTDRAMRAEIEAVVGDEKKPPVSRLDARRRATAAAQNAIAVLRSEGYYDAELTPEIGEGEKPKASVHITLGPRTELGPTVVEWVGAPPDGSAQSDAVSAVALQPGQPGRAAEVIAAEGRIIAFLQQHGYADAKAEPRAVVVDHADRRMHPTFKIAAGSLVKLGALRIEASGRTRARYIDRLRPWKVGEVYKPDRVAEMERRLLDTQVYDSVTVALAPGPGPDGLRPVIVNLADRPRHTLEFSAGYSTSEGGDFDIRWSSYDRFGRADTLTYEARLATIDSKLGVDLTLPNWRSPGLVLHPATAIFRTETDAYNETGVRAAVDLTQRYGKTSYFTRGVSLTASEVKDKETGSINIVALRFLGALALDRSDNPLDPRRGFKIEARAEPTGIVGDEQLLYLKMQGAVSGYLPLDKNADTVVAARVHIGSIVGGKIPQVPSSDRFFAGGGGSVRGYDYQGVGPRYADGKPQGGLAIVETAVELRRRFTDKLGGVLFVDSGSVATNQVPDVAHVFSAVGVGLRYNLGFAPVRVDIATPLQKPAGTSPSAFQVYLSIGQAF